LRCAYVLLSMFALAAVALAIFRPGWASRVGLDVWNVARLERDRAAQDRRAALLDTQCEIIRDRCAAKEHVVRDLLARRLTLLEAASDFRSLNAEPPDFPCPPPEEYPGRTENERYCRLVLDRVRSASEDLTPSHADEILRLLEEQLETHLAAHGGEVTLPGYEAATSRTQ
jgi:hypothetical protein